ncbi:MAG: hypothetical protein WBG43_00155 [Marinifilaceae bacterium]
MRKLVIIFALFIATIANAQEKKAEKNVYKNLSDKMLTSDSKLSIGGYGEVNYKQGFGGDTRYNGKLDVQRFVMMLGYKFNEKTSFVTELEFEHVKEVYVEQAFLQYKLNSNISLRGGLMLTPMGITNEYHEPTSFNGVSRPSIDKYIAPTTWREIGVGIIGYLPEANIKYQAYVMNGFNGFDDSAKFNAKNGFRKGRQKGAESFMSSPNLSAKVEYYGIKGLNLGLSGYFGDSQSKAYDGLDEDIPTNVKAADATVVGISMLGADARYRNSGLELKAQYYYTSLSNTENYNMMVDAKDGKLGSSMTGYYAEAGYNVLRSFDSKLELVPFARYEKWNTQNSMEGTAVTMDKYERTMITTGLTLKLARGAVVKTDVQFAKSAADDKYATSFNAGIGIMF